MTNTTEAALRDALEFLTAIRRREVQMEGAALSKRSWYEMENAYNQLRDKIDAELRRIMQALSQPSPASSTAGEDEVAFWHDVNIDDTDANREAVKAAIDFMRLRLSPSSGEPASVAVEAIKTWEQRAEEHPDHEAYCVTPDMIQQRMQEEIDDLRAALSKPTPVEAGLREALDLLKRWKDWSCGQVGLSPFHETRSFLAALSETLPVEREA